MSAPAPDPQADPDPGTATRRAPAAPKSFMDRAFQRIAETLGALIAVALVVALANWFAFHPHGPHFLLRVLAVVFGLPLLGWFAFWAVLYRQHLFKWFYVPGQRWRKALGLALVVAASGRLAWWLASGG